MRLQAWTSPPFRPSMRTRPPPRSSMRALRWIGGGSCSGGSSSSSGGSGIGIGGKSSTGRSSSRCRFGGRVLGDGVQVRGVHAGGDCSSEARSSEACHSTQCTGWQIMFYKKQKAKNKTLCTGWRRRRDKANEVDDEICRFSFCRAGASCSCDQEACEEEASQEGSRRGGWAAVDWGGPRWAREVEFIFIFLIYDFKLFLISEFYVVLRVLSNTGAANSVADHDPSAQNWPEDSGGLHLAGQTYNEGGGGKQ